MKPNCYECKHRRQAMGSTHSECVHPDAGGLEGAAMFTFLRTSPDSLQIAAKEHGIQRGWFSWPLDFDPIWLENCRGFTSTKVGGENT